MWIWVCVAIVVVGAVVHVVLGRRVWLALKGLFAAAGALERTASGLERELSRIGMSQPAAVERPRHDMEVDRRA